MNFPARPDQSLPPLNPFAAPAEPTVDAIVAESRGKPGPGFWAALGWSLLLVMVLNGVAIFVAVVLLIAGLGQDQLVLVLMPVTTTITFLSAVALSLAWFGRFTARRLAFRPPAIRHVGLALLLVAPLAVVMQEVAAWAGEILPTFNTELYLEFAEAPWSLVLVAGCLLPGVGEEIFFRGFLGRGLVARMGLAWGTAWCAFLFAAIHLDPTQAVGILVIGVALQLVLASTCSLWIPILIHALNNALSFSMVKLDLLTDLDHLPRPVVASAALVLVLLAVLFYRTRSQWILPDGEPWNPGYLTAEMPPRELDAHVDSGRVPLTWLAALGIAYTIFVTAGVQMF